jgi:heptosyltransferase I
MTPTQPHRLLLIRMDRIGDLILTLPVDEALALDTHVKWWIPKGLSFITSSSQPPRAAREVSRKISILYFFSLLKSVRDENFDSSLVFHAPWWVSLLLYMARIPQRAGVKSQWHSFLFLNRAIRQKRSRAEHSELEYNFQLMEEAFGLTLERRPLKLKSEIGETRDSLLRKFALSPKNYSVVHPGMGGSALNWPTERYEELIRTLARTENVVITGTQNDEQYLSPLRERLQGETRVVWLDGKLSGTELVTVLANARTITAPSTGVLHLAASTGRPTLGLFSPVRVQKPRRWGPQGERVATLTPNFACPGEMRCLGAACPYYDCMKTIQTSQALEILSRL